MEYQESMLTMHYAVVFAIQAMSYKGKNSNYQINLLGQIIKPGNWVLRCHHN